MCANRFILWLAVLLAPASTALAADATGPVDFNRDVRPILSDACLACHGPDAAARKAALRLDVRDAALAPARSGALPIVPGEPAKSELIHRILSDDADERMPPPQSKKHLTDAQKQTLLRWVREGGVYEPHWAFIAPVKPAPPHIRDTDWPRNDIDRFVLAKLEREGVAPSPEADRATLIRRVTLDLTGLPPTPDEVAAFLDDPSPDAYEAVVDRLISTRAYAERRAQDWLDLARYADTRGFADDKPRDIWPWRDWVVEAIHANMPFDRFTIEQLAGDMLPDATQDQRIASAFHRNAPQARGMTYPVEEYRLKGVADRVNTTGTVWLGLTLACAECHDHKFDPVSQAEYYRLFAIFNNTEHSGSGFGQGGPLLKAKLRGRDVSIPVMAERSEARATFVHVRGSFLAKGERVEPGVPAVFGVTEADQPRDRLALARWLVSGKHPLVARVVVNRYWQGLFGHGLVSTPEDFGLRGAPPSHPALLDWLATRFVQSGWDMKAMHRLIVTSATYRQSARVRGELAERDAGNAWLAFMPRVRLPAEQIRDQALAVSGLLKPCDGGPPVFPPQPEGYWQDRALPGEWKQSGGDDLHRRSMYVYWRRMALHPAMELLDGPSRAVCTVKRSIANVPTQALVTLNDPIFVEASRALAQRVLDAGLADDSARLDLAFALCLARAPDEAERRYLLAFIAAMRERYPDDATGLRAWAGVATVLLNLDETLTRP